MERKYSGDMLLEGKSYPDVRSESTVGGLKLFYPPASTELKLISGVFGDIFSRCVSADGGFRNTRIFTVIIGDSENMLA